MITNTLMSEKFINTVKISASWKILAFDLTDELLQESWMFSGNSHNKHTYK